MFAKIRIIPVLTSLVLSSVILFGGWYFYHHVKVENPFQQKVQQIEGVAMATTQVNQGVVQVTLELEPTANLREIYTKVTKEAISFVGHRTVSFDITNSSSRKLDDWWSSALFDIAQAMETKRYSLIPITLQKKAAEYPNLKAHAEIDEQRVYIQLTDGVSSKFIILPRIPSPLGVWSV